MSFNQSLIRNASLMVAALFTTSTLITATTANATRGGDIYRVELAQPASDTRFITRDTIWRCEGTRCVAPNSGSSDRHVCVWVARETGEVTAFHAGDRTFNAEELAACNARS